MWAVFDAAQLKKADHTIAPEPRLGLGRLYVAAP